jgi:cell division control protein 24
MSLAPRTSQLSGSTAFAGSSASLSSLVSSATAVANQVAPTQNIINEKADASRSLYQICVSLKHRLSKVPYFEGYLDQLDPTDPVDPLWNLLRTGHPLLTIYNSLQPEVPLRVDENVSEAKKSKIAVFKFVKACMDELNVSASDSFVITDLLGNDTSGFVKVRPR